MSNDKELDVKRAVLGLVKLNSGKVTTAEVREAVMNEYAYTSKQAHTLIQELFTAGFMSVKQGENFEMILSYGYDKDPVIEEMLRVKKSTQQAEAHP